MSHQPERLNLWDRFFNRYRREIHNRGSEMWGRMRVSGGWAPDSDYYRLYVEYRVIDRLTGSETIERDYLN